MNCLRERHEIQVQRLKLQLDPREANEISPEICISVRKSGTVGEPVDAKVSVTLLSGSEQHLPPSPCT